MKKRLLFGALLMGSFFTASAQDSCDDAIEVTPGDYTVSEISGDFEVICVIANEQADAAAWYSFTATDNGLLTISSAIEANPSGTTGTDTRITAYTGECDALECYAFNDDQGQTDYRSMITIPVEDGATYYFAWDNNWQDTEFDFTVSFEAVSCLPVTGGFAYVGQATTSEVTLEWTAALGEPVSYTVIYGETGFDPETEGTTVTGLTTPEVTISGLDAGSSYDLYVITICAEGEESDMAGPVAFDTAFAAVAPPYESGFEDNGADLNGWSIFNNGNGAPWQLAQEGDASPYEGDLFFQAGASINPTDVWLFSRALDLEGGQEYTVSYYAARFAIAGEGNVNNLEVTYGTEATVAAQTNVLATFDNYDEDDYVLQQHTFTAPETGVYYIGFNYTGPSHVQANFGVIAVDNFAIQEGTAGVNDVLASKFTVYPNPANNVINIANAENILVNGVVITDLNGRTVKNVSYNGVTEAQINVSDLAAGMYMMTVSSDKGTMTKKIVKN